MSEYQIETRDGGKYEFDDGGCYCGQWEDGKAHGHGVCTGPRGQGEYSGSWHYGYEVAGVYTWPSGTVFEGQWESGKRQGLGLERRGRWVYRGEWSQGFMGRYGVRVCRNTQSKYEGTWQNGLQDGYGVETYVDSGTYQGQWCRGMRHGYGVRKSAPYGVAAKMRSRSHAHASLTSIRSEMGDDASADKDQKTFGDESRGGFALRACSNPPTRRRSLSERSVAAKRSLLTGLRFRKNRSTSDIHQRSTTAGVATGETARSMQSSGSTASCTSDESGLTGSSIANGVVPSEDPIDPGVIETYTGEWKNDRRSGFGVSDRSDGLKYEGEWLNNRKNGYGLTSFKDGTKEEGKYKNNVLIFSQRKKNLVFLRASKMRERIDAAVNQAVHASQTAIQKAEIATSRMQTARDRAKEAETAAAQAREDSDFARLEAKRLAPEFHQPGTEVFKRYKQEYTDVIPYMTASSLQTNHLTSSETTTGLDGHTAGPEHIHPAHRSRSLIIPKSQLLVDAQNRTFVPEPSGVQLMAEETDSLQFQSVQTTIELPNSQRDYSNSNSILPDVLPPAPTSANHSSGNQHRLGHSAAPPNLPSADLPQTAVVLPQQIAQDNIRTSHRSEHVQRELGRESSDNYARFPRDSSAAPALNKYREDQTARTRPSHPNDVPTGYRHHGPPARAPIASNPNSSPSVSQSPSHSSPRLSLIGDHYNQYGIAGYPPSTMASHQYHLQHRQPQESFTDSSPTGGSRNPHELSTSGLNSDTSLGSTDTSPSSSGLIRRSTLATAEDRRGREVAFGQTHAGASSAERRGVRPRHLVIDRLPDGSSVEMPRADSKQSLPDAAKLVHSPPVMSREEVSRLSSQRREEIRRIRDEQEILRSNPLRYLLHPALREWILRRKLFLIMIMVNLGLSLIFQRLLSYDKHDDDDLPAPD